MEPGLGVEEGGGIRIAATPTGALLVPERSQLIADGSSSKDSSAGRRRGSRTFFKTLDGPAVFD